VEVDHDGHTQSLGPLALYKEIFLAAPVAMCRRINPYAMAHSVESQLLHQGCTLAFLTILIIKLMTIGLIFSNPSKVSSEPEFRLTVTSREGNLDSKRCHHAR
jgi:hypothetical protein